MSGGDLEPFLREEGALEDMKSFNKQFRIQWHFLPVVDITAGLDL